ncbi:MAG: ABC transporter ATP-binding protein [Alphaproteobacteria bacterium]
MPVLEVQGLSRRFGGLTAVSDVSFAVEDGAIHGLIGPNGAGKTTTFNVISGFYRPSAGRVIYQGRDIGGLGTAEIARRGLVRTFQSTTLFREMTVLENVLVGRHLHARASFFRQLLGLTADIERKARTAGEGLLDFVGLAERAGDAAGSLSHGMQRALGIAVALAAEPRVLLLDEPFTGMNPEETGGMMALMRKVRDRGVTMLLVEHDMTAVMGLCDRITVLSFGRLLAEGDPQAIRNHPAVIEAYLGASLDAA